MTPCGMQRIERTLGVAVRREEPRGSGHEREEQRDAGDGGDRRDQRVALERGAEEPGPRVLAIGLLAHLREHAGKLSWNSCGGAYWHA
jgi:hypothetical protein